MLVDFLVETMTSGGWVLLPILIIGALGFYLVGLAYLEVGLPGPGNNFIRLFDNLLGKFNKGDLKSVEKILKSNKSPLSGYVQLMIDNKHLEKSELENLLKEKLNSGIFLIDRHIPMIGVFAAVAPLLGLLGTVTGMVSTFDVITVFGNSNPMLMSDGISQALITTQSGLVIAFPLVLMHHQLSERIDWIKKQLELVVTQFINNRYDIKES